MWWGRRDSHGVLRHFEPLTSAISHVYGFLHALLKIVIPNGQQTHIAPIASGALNGLNLSSYLSRNDGILFPSFWLDYGPRFCFAGLKRNPTEYPEHRDFLFKSMSNFFLDYAGLPFGSSRVGCQEFLEKLQDDNPPG